MSDLPAVVRDGDRAASLEALRDLLADRLADDSGRNTAAIAKQLTDVLRELEALKAPAEDDGVDEVARQRAHRRAAAAAQQPSAL